VTRGRLAVLAGVAVAALLGPSLPAARAAETVVQIDDRGYSPDPLAVHVGDTVTWRNTSDEDHNVRGGPFNSPAIHKGSSFSFTFTRAGTVDYVCDYHPTMKGTVKIS
jgi:plastocyanin